MAAVLADPVFLREAAEAQGGANVEVDVQATADGFCVLVTRDVEVEVPALIRRLVRPMNRVAQKEVWRRNSQQWSSEFELHIGGLPTEVRGATVLTQDASGGCHHQVSFEVRSKLPILARKLESFVADQVEQSIKAEFDCTAVAVQKAYPRSVPVELD